MQLAVLQKNPFAKTQGIITPSKQKKNELIADTRYSFNQDLQKPSNQNLSIIQLLSIHEQIIKPQGKWKKLVRIHLYYSVYHM